MQHLLCFYQAALERGFYSFLELQSVMESLLMFLVLFEWSHCLQINFLFTAKAFWILRSVWLDMIRGAFLQAHPKHIKGRGKVCECWTVITLLELYYSEDIWTQKTLVLSYFFIEHCVHCDTKKETFLKTGFFSLEQLFIY